MSAQRRVLNQIGQGFLCHTVRVDCKVNLPGATFFAVLRNPGSSVQRSEASQRVNLCGRITVAGMRFAPGRNEG